MHGLDGELVAFHAANVEGRLAVTSEGRLPATAIRSVDCDSLSMNTKLLSEVGRATVGCRDQVDVALRELEPLVMLAVEVAFRSVLTNHSKMEGIQARGIAANVGDDVELAEGAAEQPMHLPFGAHNGTMVGGGAYLTSTIDRGMQPVSMKALARRKASEVPLQPTGVRAQRERLRHVDPMLPDLKRHAESPAAATSTRVKALVLAVLHIVADV